jgi:(p)ppGpp synthase/HD superfamily hydrolase
MKMPPPFQPGESAIILTALQFTVQKHLRQMSPDSDNGLYLNQRIVVTDILSRIGHVTDTTILTAAILHHVFDDTQTLKLELDQHFGSEVRYLVQELAEDKSTSEMNRMLMQLERAPTLSFRAKTIILAEKISNLQEISTTHPADWPLERKCGYMTWLVQIVANCRGVNSYLEQYFDELLQSRMEMIHFSPLIKENANAHITESP